MEEATKELKRISEKYGLKLNEALYEYKMGFLLKKLRNEYENILEGQKEDLELYLILNVGLCSCLSVGRQAPKLPEWAKQEICYYFMRDEVSIFAVWEKADCFTEQTIERYQRGGDFEELIDENQKREYELTKIFNEEEANEFLVQQVMIKFNTIVEELNAKGNYDKMAREFHRALKVQLG